MLRKLSLILILTTTNANPVYAATGINALKCPELVEAANKAALAHRALGSAASEQISSGESLKNRTCLDDVQGFKFDFFSSIPSLSGAALKKLQEKVVEEMTSLACNAGNELVGATNKILTCNAALGLKLDGGAGFDSIDVSECGGIDLDAEIDGGSHNVGGNQRAGGSVDIGVKGSNREGKASTASDGWSNWIKE